MKKSKIGFAFLTFALFGASSLFANKITLTNNENSESKEYDSIQKALDAIPTDSGDYTISLEPGTYEEVLYYNGGATIKLSGQSSEKYGSDVLIAEANSGDLYKQKRAKSAQNGRCIFEFEGDGNLILENLTMQNTFARGSVQGSNTQAETIGFDSTGKLVAYNCAFKSHQDTLRMTGKSWFYKCYIEGDTDFIWMEANGKVALFEECEIRALYDEKKTPSYVCAPRMNFGTRLGKGLVIYNSTISSDEGQTTYLARTPWNSGYYNQVACVRTNTKGISQLWYGDPLTAPGADRTKVGWKIDAGGAGLKEVAGGGEGNFYWPRPDSWYGDPIYTQSLRSRWIDWSQRRGYKKRNNTHTTTRKYVSASTGKEVERDDVIPGYEVSTEFNGRRAILNRYYDYARDAYRKDYEDTWAIDDLIKQNGWTVTPDSSKELVGKEQEAEITRYNFVDNAVSYYPAITNNGFESREDNSGAFGTNGSTLSFPVKEKCAVTVYGRYSGKGAINSTNQGFADLDFNNGSRTVEAEKEYIVYEKDGGTVTIRVDEDMYITRIVIEPDPLVQYSPIKQIVVRAKDDVTEMESRKKLQFYADITPGIPTNKDYVWSVSDESAATISEFGVLTSKALTEDKTITVTATACDTKKVAGSYKILIHKVDPKAFTASWLDSLDASKAPYAGTSDNTDVATVSNAVLSGKGSNWANNTSKYNSSYSDGGVSYTGYKAPIKGKDAVYIDFPITAKKNLELQQIAVAFGNHGTGNIAASVQIIRKGVAEELFADTSRKARQTKKTFPLGENVAAGETVVIRVALYGYANEDTEIATGKAPTIGTVQISGYAE